MIKYRLIRSSSLYLSTPNIKTDISHSLGDGICRIDSATLQNRKKLREEGYRRTGECRPSVDAHTNIAAWEENHKVLAPFEPSLPDDTHGLQKFSRKEGRLSGLLHTLDSRKKGIYKMVSYGNVVTQAEIFYYNLGQNISFIGSITPHLNS